MQFVHSMRQSFCYSLHHIAKIIRITLKYFMESIASHLSPYSIYLSLVMHSVIRIGRLSKWMSKAIYFCVCSNDVCFVSKNDEKCHPQCNWQTEFENEIGLRLRAPIPTKWIVIDEQWNIFWQRLTQRIRSLQIEYDMKVHVHEIHTRTIERFRAWESISCFSHASENGRFPQLIIQRV